MKSQAETAGRLRSSSSPHPQKGTVLRDVELFLPDRGHRLLSVIRGQRSLVMVFTSNQDARDLLTGIASAHHALKEHSARVFVISPGSAGATKIPGMDPDQVVFATDPTGTIYRTLGAIDTTQTPVPALYITDRFGEIFAAFHATEIARLPSPQEIIRWLEFINYQCEECSPSEWQE